MLHAMTRSKDVRAGLVSAGLGAIFLVAAMRIREDPSSASVLGPKAFPMLISLVTIACSVVLVVRGLRAPAESEPAGSEPAGSEPAGSEPAGSEPAGSEEVKGTGDMTDIVVPPEPDTSRIQVLVAFALFTVYIVAFIPVGYLVSTFGFLTAMATYVERDKLFRNAVFAAVFSVAVYLLFTKGLQVQLPPGLLG